MMLQKSQSTRDRKSLGASSRISCKRREILLVNTLLHKNLRGHFCLSRFYIGCDRCQNWYHGRCVGILQSEANHIDEYVCPQCQSTEDAMTVLTPLTDKDYEGLRRTLRSLQVNGRFSIPSQSSAT